MSPLLVLISVLIGAGIGGILGAIVAIPAGASVQILVRDMMRERGSVPMAAKLAKKA
jgi:predicted PurR-regulated permease PerM